MGYVPVPPLGPEGPEKPTSGKPPRKDRKPRHSKARKTAAKPSVPIPVTHTKRQELTDEQGWTHIVERPRVGTTKGRKRAKSLVRGKFHFGDFEVDGVSYVNRELGEMKSDFVYWQRQWELEPACAELKKILGGEENPALVDVGEEVEQKEETSRRKVKNVVVLGLGSLQSSRREARKTSATQLAALQTIVQTLSTEGRDMPVVFQDPQFTATDKEFLASLGQKYEVVENPDAFWFIGERTAVFAVHCYADVYRSVCTKGKGNPAVLICTDVGNFSRFGGEGKETMRVLTDVTHGCEEIPFPQLRHDFSDTKIYWRRCNGTEAEEVEEKQAEGIDVAETEIEHTKAEVTEAKGINWRTEDVDDLETKLQDIILLGPAADLLEAAMKEAEEKKKEVGENTKEA